MNVIILASDKGHKTNNISYPKCMIEHNGVPLISDNIRKLSKLPFIDNITMVIGYKHSMVINTVYDINGVVPIIYNDDHEDFSMVALSKYLKSDFIKNDRGLLVINGNSYIDDELIDHLSSLNRNNNIIYSREDINPNRKHPHRLVCDNNGVVIKIGKYDMISDLEFSGITIGVTYMTPKLLSLIRENDDNKSYMEVLNSLLDKINIKNISLVNSKSCTVYDGDDYSDIIEEN